MSKISKVTIEGKEFDIPDDATLNKNLSKAISGGFILKAIEHLKKSQKQILHDIKYSMGKR